MSGRMKRRGRSGGGDEPAAKRVQKIRQSSLSDDDDDDDENISQATPDFTIADSSEVTELQSFKGPEPGVIERVSVRNFMCHERLTVPIGEHVNFIIGKNGSGKSAVMTAVVVGLGGKAAATNRGNSIKSFIKTGKQSADISVSLCNRGQDAYKHDVYGDTITVERRLVADGGGGYKIKNSAGKLMSDKRPELNNILDHFNIQVDNPVSILNQDTSKSFLNSKSPKDKYKFFLKATHLEQMKEDYKEADCQKQSSVELLKRKQDTLPELECKVLEWEQKYKALEAVDELKEKVKRLQNEMAWAFVAQKERGLEPLAKELRQEEARTPKYEKKVEEFHEKVETATGKFRSIQEGMKAMSEDAESLQSNHNATKQEREAKRKVAQAAQKELNSTSNELKFLMKDKQQVEDRLKELRNSAENDYSEQRRAREEKIEKLTDTVESLRAQQKTTTHDMEQFQQAVAHAQEQASATSMEVNELNQRLKQASQQVRNLESARSNKMRRFGQHMPDLLKRIDDAHRQKQFHQKPRGPIGAHITLREQRWAPATEMCLKALLHSFACHDHHDRDKLERIFKASCPTGKVPTVIVSRFKDTVHNVSQHRVQSEQFPTLFDLLEMEDPVVANCLIDQRSIENVVMFEDVNAAREVMLKRPPRKAKEGFTITGDQLYAAPNFRYYSNKDAKANVLTANLEEDIQEATSEVEALRREVGEKQGAMKQHQAAVTENQKLSRSRQQTLNSIRQKINQVSYELNELRNMEDPAPQEDISTLEEDARQIDAQLAVYQTKVNELKDKYQAIREDYEVADRAFTLAKDELHTITERTTEFKDQLANSEKAIDDAKFHHRHYQTKKVEHDRKVADLQKRKDAYEKEIEQDIAKAKTICEERISTRRAATNLESEISQIKKRISAEEKVRGSRDEITRAYHEKMDAYKKIKKEVNQLANFLRQLEHVMSARKKAFAEFRRMIAVRAKFFFITLLSSRQYNGRMEFNYKEESLSLSVQPTQAHVQTSKDMRSLSGGERSFSTVCFILALWDTMENPFRMLDEFDVFMDMVNRRIAMDLMLCAAKKNPSRQFIFLTPLDMSYITLPPTARVHQMQEPERGQTTLPYERKRKQDTAEANDDDEDN